MTERTLVRIIKIIVITLIITISGIMVIDDAWSVEIGCYAVEMQITHAESTSYYVKNEGVQTKCTLYLSNTNKTIVLDVNQHIYALYSEGDLVKVEIQTLQCPITRTIKERAAIVERLP